MPDTLRHWDARRDECVLMHSSCCSSQPDGTDRQISRLCGSTGEEGAKLEWTSGAWVGLGRLLRGGDF